jgi:MFS family permease
MENRWIILAVLFTVRTVMGIQFQSVASVSPFLIKDLDIDYTRLGILIGLYHLPGVVLAFPGGLLGKRFGDKRIVMSALVLMAVGGLIMGLNDSYAFSVMGRLLSGFGGILLNVLLTKMIADWFAGKEIITAAGFSRDLTHNAATPVLFGGMLLIIAIIILAIFRTFQARIKLMPAE